MRQSIRSILITLTATHAILAGSSAAGTGNAYSSGDSAIDIADTTEFTHPLGRSLTEMLGRNVGVAVVATRPDEAFSLTTDHLSVRGGGFDNLRIYLDGLGVTDPFTGFTSFAVCTQAVNNYHFSALETSGRYPSGALGVADFLTGRGGGRVAGFIEAVSDNQIGSNFDRNRYSIGLGGPVAHFRAMRFSVVAEKHYLGDHRPSIKTADILPGGPGSLPRNSLEGWNYSGRLDWQVTDRLGVGLMADGSSDDWFEYRQAYYFDSNHVPAYEDRNRLLGITLEHAVGSNLRYRARLSDFTVERFRGDATLREDLSRYARDYVNPLADRYDLFWHAEMMSDTSWPIPDHYYDDYYRHKTDRTQFDVQADWRLRKHQLNFGLEYRRYTFRLFHNLSPASIQGYTDRNVIRYGYSWDGAETDSDGDPFHDVKHPTELALSVSDRLEQGNVVFTGSLRVDRYDYNELKFRDPARPYDPDLEGDYSLDPGDLEPSGAHWCLSPGVELILALNDWSRLTTRYGMSHQAQPYSAVLSDYRHVEAMLSAPFPNIVTWSEIEPVKTTALELGLEMEPTRSLGLTVRFFSHRSENKLLIYTRRALPYQYPHYDDGNALESLGSELSVDFRPSESFRLQMQYTMTSAEDFGSMETFVFFTWHNPEIILAEFMTADHEQSHALTAMADLKVGDDRGPAVGGFHVFEHINLGLTINYASGLPYTHTLPYNHLALTHNTFAGLLGETNAERQRSVSTVDLDLQRPIRIGNLSLTPFVSVTNLLNRENIVYVYSGTGAADCTGYLQTPEGISRIEADVYAPDGTGLGFEDKYHLAERDPLNYGRPRQVMFGLRASF